MNTVLYVKEDQDNKIEKDEEYKMFIFVYLEQNEKENKDYQDKDDQINKIFNKKYDQLTLEDIKKVNNRKIIIFKIKYADYLDKQNNPLSEENMQ